MSTIGQDFDKTIAYYDDWMKKALPNFFDLFGTAIEIIPFPTKREICVLDLGAGTGLFSEQVLRKYPSAKIVLWDLAEKLLETAKVRFQPNATQCSFIIGDYREMDRKEEFDLVISSLSIHHLAPIEKQNLFRAIHQALKPGGVFINVDQIRGETPYLQELYWNHWLNQVNRAESDKTRIEESIARRTKYDRDELLADQLAWLRQAGFENVDCVYKNFFVGVFFGQKGE